VRLLLDWLGVGAGPREGIRLLEGGVERAGLGLEPEALSSFSERIDEIVHCASLTSFAERKRAEAEAVNVGGLRHVLDLAERSGCRRFHLISTAYVAGLTSGRCPEELTHPARFFNVYEETKGRAERLADERCAKAGIGLTIYRPSIVYGHSETGRSLLFNALYYPVRAALFLKTLYERDIRERGGRRAAEMGVRLETDGWIFIPIRVPTEAGGGINVIPVDFFVRAFGAIREAAAGVYHIVNGETTKIEEIIEYGQRLYRIRGFSACPARDMAGSPRTVLEAAYETSLEAYLPYMRDRRIFGTERSGPVLERRGVHCPSLTYDIFRRCFEYGRRCGWGAKLFQD
jgi:hypothetical protein